MPPPSPSLYCGQYVPKLQFFASMVKEFVFSSPCVIGFVVVASFPPWPQPTPLSPPPLYFGQYVPKLQFFASMVKEFVLSSPCVIGFVVVA